MESGGLYDDSRMENVLIKRERISCSSQGLDSLWIPSSSSFNASTSVMNIGDVQGDNDTESRFLKHSDSKVENSNEELDGCLHHTEKKRRLSPHQVQFLEKNFEMENKLEPERKAQLANEVGLQPRQVAIWFQNRRARYKTKLLEKEYDSLKASFDKLKADYEALHKQNEKMKNEINLLTEKTSSRDKGQLKQEPYDPISPSGLLPEKAILYPDAPVVASAKQDGGSSSARSDVFDSYSPHYNEGNHSAYLEPTVDSSQVYEPDASDFSPQEEDDSPCRGLLILPPSYFPKLEFECNDDLQPNACNLGFPVQNQGTWYWQY